MTITENRGSDFDFPVKRADLRSNLIGSTGKISEILSSAIEVVQANGNGLLDKARHIVAAGYLPLTDPLANPQMSENDVFNLLCKDGYDKNDRSSTLVTKDLYNKTKVSGTLRLVFGREGTEPEGLPPLDAMNLLDVEWPHRQEGLRDNQVGEFGRFAIPDAYRGDKEAITKALVDAGMDLGRQRGIEIIYAIMPRYVARIVENAGLIAESVDNFRLREDDPAARELFDLFPRYWKKASPKLYAFRT